MFIYPWGDFHSLNLGWFLVQFKAWTEKIEEYLDNGGGTSENLANVIAPVFNAENSYLTGDYILYNDELYKALEPVPAGTWNPDAWERCLVTEEMGSSASGIDNVARLMIAGQYSNTYNYQKYAICRYNEKLWMCNTNLPAGGEEWEPSHWDEITVGAGLTGLRRSVETLSDAITDLQNIVGDGTLSGFTATNLTGAANELLGSLNTLQNAIAIVSNNNTHPAIESFQYVYVKNHSTLAEGLYRATQAIPLNDTLSTTNLVAINDALDRFAFATVTGSITLAGGNRDALIINAEKSGYILRGIVTVQPIGTQVMAIHGFYTSENNAVLILENTFDQERTGTFDIRVLYEKV